MTYIRHYAVDQHQDFLCLTHECNGNASYMACISEHELHDAGTECADHALQGDFLCHFCSNKNPVPCKETAQAMIDAGTPGNLPSPSRQ